MSDAPTNDRAAWRVWSRPNRKKPWRVVATAPSKPGAAKVMWESMGDSPGGDWLVTAPDAINPNVRPAHLRR